MAYQIPDSALDKHVAILGTTGGGKSVTARGLVERRLELGHRVCVLDPVGVWWGLRANAKGDGPGFPVAVFGGDHADHPLTEGMGEPLAKIIAQSNLPAVIDTAEMGVGERVRFLTDFLRALYRHNRAALWLVLEEADEAAPQQVRPEGTRLRDAVDQIARRGRSRGFRLTTITQRPQVISKDVLTQTSTMVAHRLTAPQDRKAVGDWILAGADKDAAAKVRDGLPDLGIGEAWVWTIGEELKKCQMPMCATFDSSRTPDADEVIADPVNLAEVDLSDLEVQLNKGDDAKTTKKVVVKDAAPAQIEAARKEGFNDGYAAGVNDERARIMAGMENLIVTPINSPTEKQSNPQSLSANGAKQSANISVQSKNNRLDPPSAALKMLGVLDTNPPIRMSWNSLAASIGNKARGGHFNTVRKWMIDSGQIIEENGLVRLVEPSEEAKPPMTIDENATFLRGRWREILGGRSAQIIDVLANEPATKEDVAEVLECAASGGHWNSAWKALRDNHIIEKIGHKWSLVEELQNQ